MARPKLLYCGNVNNLSSLQGELIEAADLFTLQHFHEVAQTEEFFKLPYTQVQLPLLDHVQVPESIHWDANYFPDCSRYDQIRKIKSHSFTSRSYITIHLAHIHLAHIHLAYLHLAHLHLAHITDHIK